MQMEKDDVLFELGLFLFAWEVGVRREEDWDGDLGGLARLENQNKGLANHSPELKR